MIFEKTINKNAGFTIIEAIVAITAISVLIFPITFLLITVFSGSKQQYQSLENIDNARIISSRFVNEIRSSVQGVDGSFAISYAGDQEIIFYSPWGTSDYSIKKIRYFVSDDNLYKGVTIPTGSPLNYSSSSEKITKVQSNLSTDNEPLFYYYDGNYNGDSDPLPQPVNINNIKFIRMNLNVFKQSEKENISIFSINTGATIRSLKENLGD
jgi:hypothetical protein